METLNIRYCEGAIEAIVAEVDSQIKDFGVEVSEIEISTISNIGNGGGQSKKKVTIHLKSFRLT